MNKFDFERVKKEMYSYCEEKDLTFVIVGSIAYCSKEDIETCDDFDCVIIYDEISKIERFPYIDKGLYYEAVKLLSCNKVDLFATKFQLYNVKVSVDFISIDYLYNIALKKSFGSSLFLKKLTDAEEKPVLQNISFNGFRSMYRKPKEIYNGYNVYILPHHIYKDDIYYSGVLLDKFIHYPRFVFVNDRQVLDIYDTLLRNFIKCYESQKERGQIINISLFIRNWDRFSQEAKMFTKNLFN